MPLDDPSFERPHHHQLTPHLETEEALLWTGKACPPHIYSRRQWFAMPFLVAWSIGMAWIWGNYNSEIIASEAFGCIMTGVFSLYIAVFDAPLKYWWARQWIYALTPNSLIRKNRFWVQRYDLTALKNVVYKATDAQSGNLGFLYHNYDPIARKKDWVHLNWKYLPQGAILHQQLCQQIDQLSLAPSSTKNLNHA